MRKSREKTEVLKFRDINGKNREVRVNKEMINKEFRESVGEYEFAYLNI